jgi:hypothetical protein
VPPFPPNVPPPTNPPRLLRPKPRVTWRFILICIVLTWILPLLWALWDRHAAHQQLQREIALHRARGEPVILQDFISSSVPDDLNATIPIRRVAAVARLNADDDRRLDDIFPYRANAPTAADVATVAEIIRPRQVVFQAMADARARSLVSWNIHWGARARDVDAKYLNDIRAVAITLSYGAWVHHQQMNDARAALDVLDLIYLARLTDAGGTSVSHCVSLATLRSATERSRMSALTLQVQSPIVDGPQASAATRATTRQQVVELIAWMLDESSREIALDRSCYVYRMELLDAAQGFAEEFPIFNGDIDRAALATLRQFDALQGACRASSYPEALGVLRSPNDRPASPGILLGMNPFLPNSESHCLREFRVLTERRVAATALALRLYALDHVDKLPSTLNALVPTYLPSIPADPFAPDGRALSYRPAPRPALYSVNQDGIDDNMDDTPIEGDGYNEWDARDAVFYLVPDPHHRPRTPATRRSHDPQIVFR